MKFKKEPIYYRVTWIDNYGEKNSDIVVAKSIADAIYKVKTNGNYYVERYIQKVEQLEIYNGGI